MAQDLKAASDRIRACAEGRNPASIEIVDEGLTAKSEGLQSVALQVLGQWGDRDSRQRLRDFIEHADQAGVNRGLQLVAVRALAACATSDDAPWALDRVFGLNNHQKMMIFVPLVTALPQSATYDRVVSEITSVHLENRRAAMFIIQQTPLSDRVELLKRFRSDPDKTLAGHARALEDFEPPR